MMRRYNRRHARFDQPDPADGSYDLSDPQSRNRYAYVRNDPVNFIDPTGLDGDDGFINTPGDADVIVTNTSTSPWPRYGGAGGTGRRATLLGVDGEVSLPSDLKDRVGNRLNKPGSDCADYISRLIAAAEKIDGRAYSTDAMKNFERIQHEGGFKLKAQAEKGTANFEGNKRVVYIKPVSTTSSDPRVIGNIQNNYAGTALNEVIHHAKNSGVYGDRVMTKATFNIMTAEEKMKNPLPSAGDDEGNARYWHPKLLSHCQP